MSAQPGPGQRVRAACQSTQTGTLGNKVEELEVAPWPRAAKRAAAGCRQCRWATSQRPSDVAMLRRCGAAARLVRSAAQRLQCEAATRLVTTAAGPAAPANMKCFAALVPWRTAADPHGALLRMVLHETSVRARACHCTGECSAARVCGAPLRQRCAGRAGAALRAPRRPVVCWLTAPIKQPRGRLERVQ
jgi:hypothetical protein